MKIKTLLLGTATAFAAVTGAQAADLAVAEPVDYVKVCDAYGAGYFYIPGSDTCLKIGGYIKATIDFYDKKGDRSFLGTTATNAPLTTLQLPIVSTTGHSAQWDMATEVGLQVTAQSMTDIGLLTGYIEYRAYTDNSGWRGADVGSGPTASDRALAKLDSAYLKAGPLKAGYFTNIYYYGGAFGEYGPGAGLDAQDNNNDQVAFSTSLGGMGLWLGIADNRDNNSGGLNAALYKGDWPDIIAAVTGTAGGLDWKLAAAATDTIFGTGYGVQLAATYTFGGGDAIRVKGAFGNGEGMAYVNNLSPVNGGTWWSAFVAGVHYWSSNVFTEIDLDYTSGSPAKSGLWNIGTETDWMVAKNFLTGIAFDYKDGDAVSSSWQLQLLAKRSF